jgi:hypothetical protein
MAWRRKQSRYGWGAAAENELRNLLTPIFKSKYEKPARICRSARSGGLFDVWAVGNYLYVFQIKRGRWGRKAAHNLLYRLHREVACPYARIFVANRYNERGKIVWVFYCLEGSTQEPGYLTRDEKAA